MLGPGNRAKGVAFVLTGLTIANVVGVPLGTFLGQQVGLARRVHGRHGDLRRGHGLHRVLRARSIPVTRAARCARSCGVFRIGQVWLALGIGAIGFGGFFAVYSYVAPMVTEVAGSPEWVVPIVLVLMGVGHDGRQPRRRPSGRRRPEAHADRRTRRRWRSCSALLALTAQWIVALGFFVFATGFVSSVLSPTIQTRLMDVAEDNQSIAAALNHSALNIGNSLGAFLGGVVIASGWGFAAPAWVGVALAVGGLGIAA